MEIINCEQGTPEWHAARLGIVTASELKCVMAKGGSSDAKTRNNYMNRLVSEVLTNAPCPAFKGNAATERGGALEDDARTMYAAQTGNEPIRVGFIRNDAMGASPDSLIGEDGGLEIKCKLPYVHIEMLRDGKVPSEHYQQIQACMAVTGRQWWDFCGYCPGLPLFIRRVSRDESYIAEINAAVKQFNAEKSALVTVIQTMY